MGQSQLDALRLIVMLHNISFNYNEQDSSTIKVVKTWLLLLIATTPVGTVNACRRTGQSQLDALKHTVMLHRNLLVFNLQDY